MRREESLEAAVEETVASNLLKSAKDINLEIQDAQRALGKNKTMKNPHL